MKAKLGVYGRAKLWKGNEEKSKNFIDKKTGEHVEIKSYNISLFLFLVNAVTITHGRIFRVIWLTLMVILSMKSIIWLLIQ
jgi:hypothetical protein